MISKTVNSRHVLVFTFLMIANIGPTFAQSPSNVSANLVLWLKANQGVYSDLNPSDGNLAGTTLATDGQSSQSWDDVSGARAHDATRSINFPVFRDNVTDNINFNPVVDFNGANVLDFNNDYIFSSGAGTEDGMTWFAVVKPDVASDSKFIFDFGNYARRGYGLAYSSDTYHFHTPRDFGGGFSSGNHNLGARTALMRFSIDFGTDQSFTLDGAATPDATRSITLTALTSNEVNVSSSSSSSRSPFTIGRQGKTYNLTGRLFDGRIAEIIGYNRDLSSTESNRIESYLAIKYGITIDQTTAQDYVASDGTTEIWNKDATHAERFNHDIAGIFRDDLSGLDQRVSKSVNDDAIVTIALDNNFTASNADATRTTAFASDLSGLSWGNNNGDVTNFVSADFPVVGNNRWARVWYAQNVNFNSTVNIQFTDSNIEDGVTYYLISETDGDGNFAISDDGVVENSGVGVVATGNTVTFAGVNLNNKFFTLALKIEANYMRHGKFFRKGSEQRMKFGKGR